MSEEVIRQELIVTLLALGYPKSLMVIEKELSQLPHLRKGRVPKRRLDLLCFAKKGGLVYPLLLIECKAIPLLPSALEQVLGYNYYVEALFVAITNRSDVIMTDGEGKQLWHEFLRYEALLTHQRCLGQASSLS